MIKSQLEQKNVSSSVKETPEQKLPFCTNCGGISFGNDPKWQKRLVGDQRKKET